MRPWSWRLLALTLATAAALPPPCADAQAAAAEPSGAATRPQADDTVRYRVAIVAPVPVDATLRGAIDLVRWQDFADMTEDLFGRLVRDAVPQAREAAATHGFFDAKIDVAVDRATAPATVTLTVVPGEPTRIASVAIDVAGPARESPEGAAAIAKVTDAWLLPKGDVFRQQAWTSAKDLAVATLAANAYAAARLTASEARIDPAARTADLSVAIESGPPFFIGEIEVRGLSRYTPELVASFANVRTGDPYGEQALDEYVRRLLASGYFASVQTTIDPDPEQAAHAKLTLSVIEARRRRLEAGAGFSTDTEYKASLLYSDMAVDGRALQMYVNLRLESLLQQADVRFVPPPRPGGMLAWLSDHWIDTYGGGWQRTDIENLVTTTWAVIARTRSLDERRTPAFGAGFYENDQSPQGAPSEKSHALYVDAEYTWRTVDDLLAPTRGWMANAQAGVGVPGASTASFGRLIGKGAAWYPLGASNTLYFRAEAGAVLAQSRVGIPSNFLFRTGGDTTVRGYAYDSLGVEQGDAIVGGRYYAVASAEATHWINASWGIAAFVDAGNAVDNLPDFRFAVGYGVGARVRTPIGPFRLDVAYGVDVSAVRVHFSVGLTF
ncbi:MAG: BamA/TamA family outer membrane protein [Burkholderiales bacterium]|nr:BamA/TamA family outer membrane protein [Burkholderiales bacterium]